MPICFRLTLIIMTWTLATGARLFAAEKLPSTPTQMKIDSLKALGEEYQGDLWHVVEAEMIQRQAETAAALDGSGQSRDGGEGAANATVITASGYQDDGTTQGKANNASIPSCLSGGSDTAPDAWYVVTLTEPMLLSAWTTCASEFPAAYDTRLGIFNSALALVDCNDDDPGCAPNLQSRITDKALNAGTYYIVVDGYGGAAGGYQLNVEWVAQPAPCTNGSHQSNAEVIASLPFVESGTTVGSCDDIMIGCELSGPDIAADYWYKVTLDTTTLLTVWTTCDTSWFDSKLAVLDSGLAQLYCNDDLPTCGSKQSKITNAALYPGEYYIVVDGYHSLEGAYEINVEGVAFDAAAIDTSMPDIIIKQDDLYDNQVGTDVVPGRTHLKVTVTTPNIGDGKLYLYGVLPANGDGTQDIRQRVYRSDGSFFDRLAGRFVFHPGHDHIHVEGWTQFRLRTVNPDSSVGPIVAQGAKTSFCVLDLSVYDSSLPNFNSSGQFHSCSGTIQGLTVGWADTYSKDLEGQNIDITGLPDGVYWLEAEVDPLLRILEKRETNNVARIMVVIGAPNQANADDYEPGDDFDQVDARPVGALNSPNLGPCNPQVVIDSLSVHDIGNDDYYKFYCNSTGGAADFVRIDLQNGQGDLDMALYNS
ncbi:MAG: lysyl oxidase family protein, partial [Candidatus Zixiibacteriota bacterium]